MPGSMTRSAAEFALLPLGKRFAHTVLVFLPGLAKCK